MREPWYQRCHACRARTSPVERDELRCRTCGRDPRSPRRRVADGMLVAAVVLGMALAAPALVLLGLAVEFGDDERRRAAEEADRG